MIITSLRLSNIFFINLLIVISRIVFLAGLCLPVVAQAQTEYGIKAGLNISDIVMTNYINPDVESDLGLKFGPHVGVFMTGTVNERVGLAGELLYSSKGVNANGNINLHYIAMPLLVEYGLSERIFGQIGPEFAYMFSATSEFGNAANTYSNKFDLGLDAGFRFAARRFDFGIRYCVGMFSVREPIEFNTTSGNEKIKYQNRVLQVSVGFKLSKAQPNAIGKRYQGVRSRRYRGVSSRG